MKTIATAVLGSLAIGSVSAILGGEIVSSGKSTYTSYMSLSKGSEPVCGAVLIGPLHVLTAASCTGQKPTYVTVGSHSIKDSSNADVLKIIETRIHYGPNLTNDFAVLKLEKKSKFDPVQLPLSDNSSSTVETGDMATALGWGSTDSSNSFALSEELRSVDLPVWDNEACRAATGFDYIDRPYLCAGGVEGKGVTHNDQGGPLVLKNKPIGGQDMVIGVCSYAREAKNGQPSVFSRVSAELSWIKSQIQ